MAKKNRVIAARMKNPEVYVAIDRVKRKYGMTDSELIRYALSKFFGREPGPFIPDSVKQWIKRMAEGMGRE